MTTSKISVNQFINDCLQEYVDKFEFRMHKKFLDNTNSRPDDYFRTFEEWLESFNEYIKNNPNIVDRFLSKEQDKTNNSKEQDKTDE